MNDLGKIAVVAGIMGALLLFGLFLHTPQPAEPAPVPVTVVEPAPEIRVLPAQSLELLDPVYSEKAIFSDGTLRIAFQAVLTEDGAESKLPFWIHNVSDDVINVLWDRCSIQLPAGNTVNVVNENSLTFPVLGSRIVSVAPAGDLFDAVIPVTEISWTEDGASLTTGILDQGAFTLVLAIERAAGAPGQMKQPMMMMHQTEPACPPEQAATSRDQGMAMTSNSMPCTEGREIVYYTFRFLVR